MGISQSLKSVRGRESEREKSATKCQQALCFGYCIFAEGSWPQFGSSVDLTAKLTGS